MVPRKMLVMRRVVSSDTPSLVHLYKAVAKGGGIARSEAEITEEYIAGLVTASLSYGLMLVALDEESGLLVGAVSKYNPLFLLRFDIAFVMEPRWFIQNSIAVV